MVEFISAGLTGTGSVSHGYIDTNSLMIGTQQTGITTPTITDSELTELGNRAFNTTNQGFNLGRSNAQVVAGAVVGTGVNLADNVWSSPLNPVGWVSDVNAPGAVWGVMDAEQRQFYSDNKDMIEASSAIAGGILTLTIGDKFVMKGASALMASSTLAARTAPWISAAGWEEKARTGVLAAQRAALLSKESFGLMSTGVGRNYLAANIAKSVASNARQEAMLYGVMWNNEVINAEGWSEDAFWIGAGLGLGAGAAAIQSRALLRKAASTPEARDALASVMSMSGTTDVLTHNPDATTVQRIREAERVQDDAVDFTTWMAAARSNSTGGVSTAPNLLAAESLQRAAAAAEASIAHQRLFNRRIEGVEVIGETTHAIPEMGYVEKVVAKSDPWVYHGLKSIGFPKANFVDAVTERRAWIVAKEDDAKKVIKAGIKPAEGRKMMAKLTRMKKEQPMVFVDGTWVAPESKLAQSAARFDQKKARSKIFKIDDGAAYKVMLPHTGEVVMDGSLNVRLTHMSPSEVARGVGRKLNYAKLPDADRFYVQEAMTQLVDTMVKRDKTMAFRVTKKANGDWLALDLADQILERGGKVNFDADAGITTRADIQRASLKAKARAVLKDLLPTDPLDAETRLKYNLPAPTSMERLEDPSGQAFRLWLQKAATEEGTSREFSEALAKQRAIEGFDLLPENGGMGPRLDGDMLKWNRDESGTFMRPAMGFFQPESEMTKLSKRGSDEAAMLKTAEKTAILVNRSQKGFVNEVARQLVAAPEMQIARKTNTLHESQSTGVGSAISQAIGELLPQRFKHRTNQVVLAASRLYERATRMADMQFTAMMKATDMQAIVTRMDTPAKAALHAQLDEFSSLSQGWDMADAVEVEPGWWAFQLEDTLENQKLLGVDKVTKSDYAMNLRLGKPIYLSTEAIGILSTYNKMTDAVLKGQNTIREARGLRPVRARKWFMPAADTKGKFVGFVFDENNEMQRMKAIVASSEAEYAALEARTLADSPTGYTVRRKEAMIATRDQWDRAAMEWTNAGYSAATLDKGPKTGGLTGAYIKRGSFMESLEWLKRQVHNQATETLETLMSEPLRLNKVRAIVEDPARLDFTRAGGPKFTRTIYDDYEQALTGRSHGWRESSILSKGVYAVEAGIDKILASSQVSIPVSHVLDVARRFGVSPKLLSQKKTYAQILETMGAKSSFASEVDFLESQNIRMPPTVRGIAGKLNSLATNVVLRWDPAMAHATMNMLGLIPTLSSGTVAGSAPSTLSLMVKGKQVKFIDSMKIIKNAIGDLHVTDKNRADWEWMVLHGDASQSTFEYRQATGEINSQAGFMKFAHNIDEWVGKASDKSENLSRQIGHLTGLKLADYHGIKGMDARHSFAREFANAAIADYTPSNRPELFNTAFGSVVGLFQSYTMSQYTKMFHWIEDGNYRAAGMQAAMQASMFGMANTYGIGELFGLKDYLYQETGEPSLMDAAYQRFGPVLGGALMHGGFAELTQIALWTRGDVSVRLPVVSGQMPAGVDVMARFSKMFVGTVTKALADGPVDAMPAILENIQREMPNRMLKGLMAVALMDGTETDRFGQVMSQTQSTFDSIARIAGVRSRRMQQELEVYYANKSDIDRDASRMESVRNRYRTDARTAMRTGERLDPVAYFEDYLAAGGNPRRFKSWMKQLMEDATTVRTAKQLKRSLETPRNQLALWRYGAYGAWDVQETQQIGAPQSP